MKVQSCIILLISLMVGVSISAQNKYDLIIKNGKIINGTGNPWYYGDIGIYNGKIARIGQLNNAEADEVIDAKGRVVAPGFIDVHGHIESSILEFPEAKNLVYDGVTTMITGNCGGSRSNLQEFFEEIKKKKPSINVASLIGHNTVRRTVMGNDNRAPSVEELEQMKEMVRKAMEDGAVGFSTGLLYIPGTFAKTDEIVELAKEIAPFDGIYTSHIRFQDGRVFESIAEAVDIGKQAGIGVEISHIKIKGKKSWGGSLKMLEQIRGFREEGVDVTIDQYPYTAASTRLGVTIPRWAQAGGMDSLKIRLKDADTRKRIIKGMEELQANLAFTDYSYAYVAECPWNPAYNGKNISEINKLKGRAAGQEQEIQTILELMEKGQKVQMIYHYMSEEDVQNLMKYEGTMIASDGGIPEFGKDNPHPRSYGTNARVLARYTRDQKLFSLVAAIRKMTGLPAQRFHLNDRGLLLPNFAADLVIFDPQKVQDIASFEQPHAYSEGLDYVIVNGKVSIKEGKYLSSRSGQVLKGPYSR